MADFLAILELTLPIFAVVALGYLAARIGMIKSEVSASINIFVFYFAMPALVIGTLARQDFADILDWRFLGGWALAALTLFALGMVVAKQAFRANRAEMALFGQGASIANVGFLAISIAGAQFGPEGIRLAAAALIIDLLVVIPMSIMIIESRGGGVAGTVFLRAIKGAIKNPFAVAILAGVTLSFTGLGLPGALDTFSTYLGNAAAPTALFSLGLSLASRQMGEALAPIVTMTTLKLVAHPIMVAGALLLFGLPHEIVVIGTVIAAMPVAQNVYVLSEHYGIMVRRSSAAILLSTALAAATVSILLYLVR